VSLEPSEITTASGLTVEVFRGGSGPALVYFHAAHGVTATDPFVAALAEHFSVTAPVSPGFRNLAELDDIRSVHDLALAFDDIFATLHLDDMAVVGHSFGGMNAAEFAAHFPGRVSSLTLVAPVGLWNDAYPVLDIFATPPAEINDYLWGDPSSAAALAGLTGGDQPQTPEELLDSIIRTVQGLVTSGKFMMPIPDRGLRRRLYRITMPTLLLWGADDRIVPARYAEDFAAGIPGATVTILRGAGHMVTLERTDDVVRAICDHVRR
jgi:pimeloyl-ACP methyl ester carboxylesterase